MRAVSFVLLLGSLAGCTNELVSSRNDASAVDAASLPDVGTPDAGTDAFVPPVDAFVAPPDDASVSGNDAAVTNAPLPRGFGCTARTTTTITLTNTGTTTWTGAAGYALAAVDPSDPLAVGGTSIPMAAGDSVAPGATYDFALPLGATGATAGTHASSWRMRAGASGGFFGASVDASIVVYPCETVTPLDFDLASVTILGSPDVRGFARTSSITSLAFHVGSWHVDHTARGTWPPIVIDPVTSTTQEATVWIIFRIGGAWYATGGERLRPDQTDKGLSQPSQMGPDWLYDAGRWGVMAGYVPSPGDLTGMMVVAGSTRADDTVMVMERTGVVLFPFPSDDVDTSFPPFAWQE